MTKPNSKSLKIVDQGKNLEKKVPVKKNNRSSAGSWAENLARSWQQDASSALTLSLLEEGYAKNDSDIWDHVVTKISRKKRYEFLEDIFRTAQSKIVGVSEERVALVQTFSFLAAGDRGGINNFFESKEDFDTFVKSFRGTGLLPSQANVIIYPVGFNALDAVNLSPEKLWLITRASIECLVADQQDFKKVAKAHELLSSFKAEPDMPVQGKNEISARLYFGAFAVVSLPLNEKSERADWGDIDAHLLTNLALSEDEEDEDNDLSEKVEAGIDQWLAITSPLGEKNLFHIGLPNIDWTTSAGEIGLSLLQQHLNLEADFSGVDLDDMAEAHYYSDEDAFFNLCIIGKDGSFYGPAAAPCALILHSQDDMWEWLEETVEKVIEHKSEKDWQAFLQTNRPRLM